MLGLDPSIHRGSRDPVSRNMDPRVKPEGDMGQKAAFRVAGPRGLQEPSGATGLSLQSIQAVTILGISRRIDYVSAHEPLGRHHCDHHHYHDPHRRAAEGFVALISTA